MRKLWKFVWDCGRQGFLESLFVADEAEVESIIGKEVFFGEVLGKHSDVYGTIERGEITAISDDQEKIDWLIAVTEAKPGRFLEIPTESITIFGYNPLHYQRADDKGAEE